MKSAVLICLLAFGLPAWAEDVVPLKCPSLGLVKDLKVHKEVEGTKVYKHKASGATVGVSCEKTKDSFNEIYKFWSKEAKTTRLNPKSFYADKMLGKIFSRTYVHQVPKRPIFLSISVATPKENRKKALKFWHSKILSQLQKIGI